MHCVLHFTWGCASSRKQWQARNLFLVKKCFSMKQFKHLLSFLILFGIVCFWIYTARENFRASLIVFFVASSLLDKHLLTIFLNLWIFISFAWSRKKAMLKKIDERLNVNSVRLWINYRFTGKMAIETSICTAEWYLHSKWRMAGNGMRNHTIVHICYPFSSLDAPRRLCWGISRLLRCYSRYLHEFTSINGFPSSVDHNRERWKGKSLKYLADESFQMQT